MEVWLTGFVLGYQEFGIGRWALDSEGGCVCEVQMSSVDKIFSLRKTRADWIVSGPSP